MPQLNKIVVIGPESTGKSTLCQQLALKYKTEWVPEYARQYLLELGRPYNYEDLLVIAKEQLALEDRICSAARKDLVFIDTDMYVMKVWCEFVFGKCHSFILDQIVKRKYNSYMLCNIDLPWVADELREYPDLDSRKRLYHMYKDILVNQHVRWVEIRGNYNERLQRAVTFVDAF